MFTFTEQNSRGSNATRMKIEFGIFSCKINLSLALRILRRFPSPPPAICLSFKTKSVLRASDSSFDRKFYFLPECGNGKKNASDWNEYGKDENNGTVWKKKSFECTFRMFAYEWTNVALHRTACSCASFLLQFSARYLFLVEIAKKNSRSDCLFKRTQNNSHRNEEWMAEWKMRLPYLWYGTKCFFSLFRVSLVFAPFFLLGLLKFDWEKMF